MRITIVQQGVWHMARESMPLAAGYLAGCIRADPVLATGCEVSIANFSGTVTPLEMAVRLLEDGVPDLVGFSVLGWNLRQFSAVAENLRQVDPGVTIVFGGTHVANQAARIFRLCPEVDIVVNGEGEFAFTEIVRARLGMMPLGDVAGISFRDGAGAVVTTPERPRILDLDAIPSPILEGVIPLTDEDGAFRYDVALMETNRGCPYHCAFCYWGGAVGQKVRSFSRARLRAELEAVARAGARTVVLCDANFGMLHQDMDFVRDLIEIRDRYGFPTALETSWAKNKNTTFRDIVRLMKREGLQSSFTLALQTLDDETLGTMNRRNMRINDWKELAAWLSDEGLDVYAELIWGAPGETPASFLRGYDELARHVTRIAAYPLLLLPNTDFTDRRAEHGFITVRGERDDFEYILANRSAGLHDHLRMTRFLFWARLLAENLVFRGLWPVLRAVAGLSQSAAILSIGGHVEASRAAGTEILRQAAHAAFADPDTLAPALEFCCTDRRFDALIEDWRRQVLDHRLPPRWRRPMAELVRFELETRPLVDPAHRDFPEVFEDEADGIPYWQVIRDYDIDPLALIARARAAERLTEPPGVGRHRFRFRFRQGFGASVRSTNHEVTAHYLARVESLSETGPAETGLAETGLAKADPSFAQRGVMMASKDQIVAVIDETIAEINETRIEKLPLDALDGIVLYGEGGVLDSIQLVNFLVGVEEKLADRLNLPVTLTSDRAVSRRISPFRSPGHLADFIIEEAALQAAE